VEGETMSENKTGKANRVKGKNVHGRVVVLTRSKPEQLALFQTFLPEEEEKYSNTIEGLDHGIGHLACMSPQKNERLTFSKG